MRSAAIESRVEILSYENFPVEKKNTQTTHKLIDANISIVVAVTVRNIDIILIFFSWIIYEIRKCINLFRDRLLIMGNPI